MSQDDLDIHAIRAQMRKACTTWACIGQVFWSENISPVVDTMFYQVIVQVILVYGSKLWVISQTTMVWLKDFHICAAYRMANKIKPRRGPGSGSIQGQRTY